MANDRINYFTDKRDINPELVTTIARDWATKIVNPPDNRDASDNRQRGYGQSGARQSSPQKQSKGKMTSAQLRKFYGTVKGLEMRLKNGRDKEATFNAILPMIKLLKAKSAYAWKREVVTQTFKDWIWQNVDSINTREDFAAFLLYFEAVVGFCYEQGLKDN